MTSTHKFIEIVHKCGRLNYPIKKVYRRMLDVDLFLHAHAGSITNGYEDKGIDGMSTKRIQSLIDSLRDGSFRWKPARSMHIPQKNGEKPPPGIPGWNDKLVQEVIRLILEAYYEPQFSTRSHGFRPQRSCHTALQEVQKWQGTKWWIEGDIKGCFQNIDHDILINILKGSFLDTKFINLIWQLLKSGYIDDWRYNKTYSGAPQGGIVGPILSNILLNEFDKEVEQLLGQWNFGKAAQTNPDWPRLRKRANDHQRQGNKALAAEFRKKEKCCPGSDQFDSNFRRLRYVRYGNAFLLGFIGSKSEAIEIKQELAKMLDPLGLTLRQDKTLVTHAGSQRASFLGYEIKVSWDNSRKTTAARNGVTYKQRSLNGNVQLLVPRSTREQWIRRYHKNGKPAVLNKYLRYSDFDICAHYGVTYRGLVNYYALAMNINVLSHVYWVMRQSFQNTLASKHNCATRAIRKKYETRINGERGWEVKVEMRSKPGEYCTARFGGIPLKVNSVTPGTTSPNQRG